MRSELDTVDTADDGVPPKAGDGSVRSLALGWLASSMLIDRARFLVIRPPTEGRPCVSGSLSVSTCSACGCC